MQLNTILLVVVGVLALLSGLSVFFGSRKQERKATRFYMWGTLAVALWAFTIAAFLDLKPEHADFARVLLFGVYSSGLFICISLFTHLAWPYKLGRWIAAGLAAVAIFLSGILLYDPNLLYTGTPTIANTGNFITIAHGWYYPVYSIFLGLTAGFMICTLIYRIRHARNRGQKMGFIIFLMGMVLTVGFSLVFDVILPYTTRYDTIWVGPVTMAASVLTYYYAILRYRMISLSTRWLKTMSYIIIICSAAMIYMVIFYVIFTALFKVPNPSTSIFVLNFIMITIVLLLFPAMNELSAFIRSLIQTNQVDLPYIIKKLNTMTTNVNLNELSDFLADHMHFSYIGMIVNGKLYGSSALPVSSSELKQVTLLKSGDKGSIWQEFNEPTTEIFNRVDINAVAELRDAKGKPFGQMLVGKPLGKMGFERRDLIQLEMIINLVAAMIDTKAK